MKNIVEAIDELNAIKTDACAGKLTENGCKKKLELFINKYGDDLLMTNRLGEIKTQPASEEKLETLKNIWAEGGTSEETFLEMARTGRALRKRKITRIVASIAAIAAAIIAIIGIVSFF